MWGREIVLTRASVVSAVGTAVALLAVMGVGITHAQQEKAVDVLVVALPVALPLLGALWSRLHVTPVWDPRDAEGVPMVPVEQVSPRQDELDDEPTDVADTDD